MGNQCCSDDKSREENILKKPGDASSDSPFYAERPADQGVEADARSTDPPPKEETAHEPEAEETPAKPGEEAEADSGEVPLATPHTPHACVLPLAFRAKVPSVVRLTMDSDPGTVDSTHQADAVVRAWVGDPAHEWEKTSGKDVTKKVRALLGSKQQVKLGDKTFGRPEDNADKVLLVEVRTDVVTEVTFTQRPLGITFHPPRALLTVQSVKERGQGQRLGVRAGMEVVAVAGEDVTAMAFSKVQDMVRARAKELPESDGGPEQ